MRELETNVEGQSPDKIVVIEHILLRVWLIFISYENIKIIEIESQSKKF